MTYAGLFDLLTPRDLLNKLRHDMERIKKDPSDRFAVFDFVVTADHMVDWLYPGDTKAQKAERDANALLQLCYHVSSGAKHFRATHRTHKSVLSTDVYSGQFDSAQFDRSQFDTDTTLGITITDEAATELGFNWLDALTLAHTVLAFWEAHAAFKESAG